MEILNQFGINPILLAAQVVNFFILLFILKKLLYGPILKVLAQRRKKIEDSLKNAEEIELRLAETQEKIDKMMIKASNEIQKMNDEAKKEIALMKEEGKQTVEAQAERIIKKGEETARAETEKMRQELMGHLAEIVAVGMEKVTGKVLNKKDQRGIIEKEVRNLS